MILITMLGLFVILASLQSFSSTESLPKIKLPKTAATAMVLFEQGSVSDGDSQPFRDNPSVYQYDEPGSIVTMYVTVRRGNSSDNTDFTWDQITEVTKSFQANDQTAVAVAADAILQVGDDNGPLPDEVGYGEVAPNATIQLRGAPTLFVGQESYKIVLISSAGKWRGLSTINLNKHSNDDTRVRNKLNFDLLKLVPNMTSLRTQFVHLYVKDESADPPGKAFVDYGLFTQVEQPNTRFLRDRLLDRNGQLYNATAFDFQRYADQIRMVDDPLYNENAFSSILEIKGNKDHTKLIQMLDDVNNYGIPIEQTFAKYFNADNYFTWLAYNILVGNVSTENQNYYLYSPPNGNKWYFLPWDYDASFPLQDRPDLARSVSPPWENGVSNYWKAVLPNRVLRIPQYRQALDEKVNEVKGILTPEQIKSMLDVYKKAVDPYVTRMPDLEYLQVSLKSRDLEFELLPADIQTNYDMYLESLKKPMPFNMGTPVAENGKLDFTWDASYDFGGQDITYDFAVSTDWEFINIVAESGLKNLTEIQIDKLKPGTYFWRVTAENTSGETQVPYNYYLDANSISHYGIKYLYITPDEQVLEK
ncbi:MAG: CotH kinase family protein [Chloroflexi bacterium]|nr:CotH kinase family protein [Chloroflexota bacterium]